MPPSRQAFCQRQTAGLDARLPLDRRRAKAASRQHDDGRAFDDLLRRLVIGNPLFQRHPIPGPDVLECIHVPHSLIKTDCRLMEIL